MKTLVLVSCPICDSTAPARFIRREPASTDPRHETLVRKTVDVVQCRDCAAVFVQRDFPESVLAEFYAIEPSTIPATMENFGWWLQNTERAIEQALDKIESEPRGPLLDVGCGRGTFLYLAKQHGWDPVGLEVNQKMATFVRDELGFPCIEGLMDSGEVIPAHYKAIVMMDVIEHLYSPVDVLRQCGRALAPGGVLVIKTPNWRAQYFKETLRHRLGRGPGHIAYIGHINQFDSRSLTLAFRRAGLETVGVWPSQTFLPAIRGCAFDLRRTADYVAKRAFNAAVGALHAVTGVNVAFNLLAIARKTA